MADGIIIYDNFDIPKGPTGQGYFKQDSRRWGYGSDPVNKSQVLAYQRETQTYDRDEIFYPFGGNIACPSIIDLAPEVSGPALATAVSRLVDKYTNSDLNLGVSIGEGRESAQLIVARIQSINSAITALRKGSVGGALRHIGKVRPRDRRQAAYLVNQGSSSMLNLWMELRYGWIPMFADMQAAWELIKPAPVVNRLRSGKTHSNSKTVHDYKSVGISLSGTVKVRKSVSVFATVYQQPTWVERLGLNDPTMLYELANKSFVLDWFSPVGDTIRSNVFRHGDLFWNAGYTKFNVTRSFCHGVSSFTETGVPKAGYARDERIFMQRNPGLGTLMTDIEGLASKMNVAPKIDRDLSRFADLAAMYRNQLRK